MPLNPTRQVALTQNVSVLVAAANSFRKFIAFAQTDNATLLYVSNVQTDNANGFPIMPRAAIGWGASEDKIDVTMPWYCYTTGAGQVINVIEGFLEEKAPTIVKTKPPGRA